MSPRSIRRGYDPDDARLFTGEALAQLRTAQEEMRWLINRGYPMGSVTTLVGGHHQLTARQRTALQRATASDRQCDGRRASELPLTAAKEGRILIDGFNLVITLEVALSGSLLIHGMDGVFRDLAGLRGTYRIITQTEHALNLIGKALADLSVPEATFYLDANVSNSGRLRQKILEQACSWPLPVMVELVPNADRYLSDQTRIVTSDSFVLDGCRGWLNLSRKIIVDAIPDAWIVCPDPSAPVTCIPRI